MDDLDLVTCKDYKYFGFNRKVCKRKSGGVGLLVKDKLSKYIKILNSDNENCLWFTIDEQILKKKVIFAVIYIPPEGSSYSSMQLFDNIENDILKFASDDTQVCLLGDLNAKSGSLSDFIEFD